MENCSRKKYISVAIFDTTSFFTNRRLRQPAQALEFLAGFVDGLRSTPGDKESRKPGSLFILPASFGSRSAGAG
jgi:hypothetical protein